MQKRTVVLCALAAASLTLAGSAGLSPARSAALPVAEASAVFERVVAAARAARAPRADEGVSRGLLRSHPLPRMVEDRDDVHGIACVWTHDPAFQGDSVRIAIVPEHPADFPHAFAGWREVHSAVVRVTPFAGRPQELPLTRVGPGQLATQVSLGWLSLVTGATIEVLGWEEGADTDDDAAAVYALRSDWTTFP